MTVRGSSENMWDADGGDESLQTMKTRLWIKRMGFVAGVASYVTMRGHCGGERDGQGCGVTGGLFHL